MLVLGVSSLGLWLRGTSAACVDTVPSPHMVRSSLAPFLCMPWGFFLSVIVELSLERVLEPSAGASFHALAISLAEGGPLGGLCLFTNR